MIPVAFTTYRDQPEIDPDDHLAAERLCEYGIEARAAVWNDPRVDWTSFAGVVIRSCWDYHLHPTDFVAWLHRLSAQGVRVWNRPDVVLGNIDKRYLLDLVSRGVNVVPTVAVPRGTAPDLRSLMEQRGWTEVVVKPCVSAGAFRTWRTRGEEQLEFAAQVEACDTLVQEYMPEIETGEWSMLFFDGQYSHAVCKRPAVGDFRVQQHMGGTTSRAVPPAPLIAEARAVLETIATPLVYARVDGVVREGRFLLMELEINEPYLFLGHDEQAADRFAKAIARVVGEKNDRG